MILFFLEFTKTSTTIGLGSAEKINFLHFFKIFKIANALANYSSCFFLLSFIFFFLPILKCLSIVMSQDGSHWPSLAHWFSLTHSAKLKLAKSGSNPVVTRRPIPPKYFENISKQMIQLELQDNKLD